jgi:hypothetical protein
VEQVLDIFHAELSLTMRQCGTPSIAEIGRASILRNGMGSKDRSASNPASNVLSTFSFPWHSFTYPAPPLEFLQPAVILKSNAFRPPGALASF